jgi:NAD(P)-dependent dehydrogenase (short-subunit alcohol dehydrogenase family)
MFNLTGRTIFVAGGAGHLGRPICAAIAAQGGRVFIADMSPERLEAAIGEVRDNFGADAADGAVFDIGEEAAIDAAIEACTARFGAFDGLVNATYGGTGKAFDDLTADDFDRANHLNLTGSFILARKAAAQMPGPGAMVMFASMYGLVAPNPSNYPAGMMPNPIEYGAGKAGLVQMTRYMAGHFGPRAIRVNAVAPGPYPNPAVVAAHPDFIANLSRSNMLGRIGAAHETAGAVVFLLSQAASYITGQVLSVDGGWTSW